MSVDFRVEGLDEILEKLSNLEDLKDRLAPKFSDIADEYIEQIKSDQMSGRSGDQYVDVRTGNLRDSLRYVSDDLTIRVISDAPYAVYLEYGTSKMPQRLFMRDVLRDEYQQKYLNAVSETVEEALQ